MKTASKYQYTTFFCRFHLFCHKNPGVSGANIPAAAHINVEAGVSPEGKGSVFTGNFGFFLKKVDFSGKRRYNVTYHEEFRPQLY